MSTFDFIAIGDVVVDDFIKIKDARVTCDINDENCMIAMRFGDKIPFESATRIAGVGNAANAAVAAARLGLSTAYVANVGNDYDGKDVMESLKKERLDTTYIATHEGGITNHHYVLWYESERTILVKPETYPYQFPADLPQAKALYLTSLGDVPESYYESIESYLNAHPDMFVTFQPGTFQMKLGTEKLARIYARTDLLVVNKEEAARILGLGETHVDIRTLIEKLSALGPKRVIVTDNRNGADTLVDGVMLHIPMYPDDREPFERTGAGDAFASTITAAIALGKPFEEALLWGPINSMSVVQDIGAQRGLLSREKLEDYLKEAPESYVLGTV